jgi:hypothetical protein
MDPGPITTALDLMTESTHAVPISFGERSNEASKALLPLKRTGERPPLTAEKRYVYVLELATYALPRARGASRVLYIGEGKKERVEQLLGNTHSATSALRRLADAICPDVPLPACLFVAEYPTKVAVQLEETRCLNAYVEAHGESTPANARWEGYIVGRVLRVVAQALFGDQHTTKCYDWPPETPNSTWVDVYPGRPTSKAPSYSLVWRWPEGWGGCTESSGRLELHGQPNLLLEACLEPPSDGWKEHRFAGSFTWLSLDSVGVDVSGGRIAALVGKLSGASLSSEPGAIIARWERLQDLAPEFQGRSLQV